MNTIEKTNSVSSNLEEGSTVKETSHRESWRTRLLGDIYASDDPKQVPKYKKYFYVFVVAFIGINQSISILIYMPGIYQMMDDLNTSVTGFDATTSIYIAFAGIAVSIPYFLEKQQKKPKLS
jgi:hypothetical protein